jgi:hypothetical protein
MESASLSGKYPVILRETAMAFTATSLWPSDIQLDARSPLSILEEQAELLAIQTGGAIIGRVSTVPSDELTAHRLDVFAPELDESRRIFTVIQRSDLYPVVLEWEGLRVTSTVISMSKHSNAMSESNIVLGEIGTSWPKSTEWRPIAANQAEFLEQLSKRMRSPAVKGLLDSLSAAINMKRKAANASKTSDLVVGSA